MLGPCFWDGGTDDAELGAEACEGIVFVVLCDARLGGAIDSSLGAGLLDRELGEGFKELPREGRS